MNHNPTLRFAIAIAIIAATASSPFAQTIGLRWNAPSRLTPAQASDVLYRNADGQSISAAELFEAEKYLRSDGSASLGGTVMTDMLTKLLTERLGYSAGTIRVRSLAPVLQWLESTVTSTSVRLRGESMQAATLNEDPNLAAVVLYHLTIFQDWTLCGANPCVTTVPGSVRTQILYDLSIPLDADVPAEARSSELILATGLTGKVYAQTFPTSADNRTLGVACDPLPSQIVFPSLPSTATPVMAFDYSADHTEGGHTNQALCAFFSLNSSSRARLTYLVDGAVANAPSTASRSAVKNNPLEFQIFQ